MRRRKTEQDASEVAPDCQDEQPTEKQNEHCNKNNNNKSMLRIVVVIFLMISAFVGYSVYTGNAFNFNIEFNLEYSDLTPDIILLYEKYDRNGNGKIDLNEFEPLAHRLLNYRNEKDEKDELKLIKPDEELIGLSAFFTPMNIEKLRNDKNAMMSSDSESLDFLKKWQEPNELFKLFPVKSFVPFIPEDAHKKQLGEVWELIPRLKGDKGKHQLASNRYNPPEPEDNEKTLFRLLSMFHKRPFLFSRFQPQGTAVTIRARNEDLVDIVFRAHAEFQLNELPYHPFWFTPAQFNGRIIANKNFTHIHYFNLYLPSEKRLNIDMEWYNGPSSENMEVDIGYIERMEILSTGPSTPSRSAVLKQNELNVQENQQLIEGIDWKEEISMEDAFTNLEKSFYPFKEACINDVNTSPEDLIRCKKARDAYSFPVTSMVIQPNGSVVHSLNANVLLDNAGKVYEKQSFLDTVLPTESSEMLQCSICVLYKEFLAEGLEKSKV